MKQKLLEDFIDWLKDKEDVYYAFDNTEKVVKELLKTIKMSETVHYKGTAKRIDLKGLTNEEFALEYIKTQGKEIPSYYDNAVEYLVERWNNYFLSLYSILYVLYSSITP